MNIRHTPARKSSVRRRYTSLTAIAVLASVVVVGTLSGCGQKRALVLPPPAQPVMVPAPDVVPAPDATPAQSTPSPDAATPATAPATSPAAAPGASVQNHLDQDA